MTTTLELVVTQLQQELLTQSSSYCTIRTCRSSTGNQQFCHRSNFGKTLRISSMWTVLDVRRNSVAKKRIFNSGRRRLRHSSGVIKESDKMLECSAEETAEITTELINREIMPMKTNVERGVRNLDLVDTQHSWLSRGRTRWRHDEDCRSDMIRRQEEGNGTCCERSFLLDSARFKKWSNGSQDKSDDEIKIVGLEALTSEEVEKYLILNSNRLRSFEDARLEIVAYVETNFGLRIGDSNPSDTGLREHSDPMDVDAVNSLSSVEGKWSLVRAMCVLSAVEYIFNETAMYAKAQASNRLTKGIKASHGPRVSPQSQAKERVKRTMENPKESPTEPKVRSKVPKAQSKTNCRKSVSQILKTWNQKEARKLRIQCKWDRFVPLTRRGFTINGDVTNGTTAGVKMNGTMTGVMLDGMEIASKRATHL